jgi:hypothetical protein
MGNHDTYIRFDGRLSEHLKFRRYYGWQTDRIAHRPEEGDGEYRLSLLDKKGQTLTTALPRVEFGTECSARGTTRTTRVVCYLPWHDDARTLMFSRRDVVIWREEVASSQPELGVVSVTKLDDGRFRIYSTASHVPGRELRFNVFYFSDNRGFTVARGLTELGSSPIDVSNLPGGKNCRFGVLATDGIRSSIQLSEPFERPIQPPKVCITAPAQGQTLSSSHIEGARGLALDELGKPLPDQGLEWFLDGTLIATAERQIGLPFLEPGSHHLSLRYTGPQGTSNDCSITFSVVAPSAEMMEWERMRSQAVSNLRHSQSP